MYYSCFTDGFNAASITISKAFTYVWNGARYPTNLTFTVPTAVTGGCTSSNNINYVCTSTFTVPTDSQVIMQYWATDIYYQTYSQGRNCVLVSETDPDWEDGPYVVGIPTIPGNPVGPKLFWVYSTLRTQMEL